MERGAFLIAWREKKLHGVVLLEVVRVAGLGQERFGADRVEGVRVDRSAQAREIIAIPVLGGLHHVYQQAA
jgi:hypothetical protein